MTGPGRFVVVANGYTGAVEIHSVTDDSLTLLIALTPDWSEALAGMLWQSAAILRSNDMTGNVDVTGHA